MTVILLHVGAHKTATTHLQNRWSHLARSSRSVACPPLDEVRKQFLPACGQGADAQRNARRWLASHCEGRDTVVVSDENMLGFCEEPFQGGQLYTQARERVARLAGVLQGHRVTVLFSVRGYADWLRSAWCETIRHQPYKPFRKSFKSLDTPQRGWEHVAGDVLQALPEADLAWWRYEDLEPARAALDTLVFGAAATADVPVDAKRERQSFSRPAIKLLDEIFTSAGPDVATKARASVEKVLRMPQQPRFDPWQPEETALFEMAYRRSLAALGTLPRSRALL